MSETKVAGIRYKKYGSGKKREAATSVSDSQTRPGKFVHLVIQEDTKALAWIHLTAKKAVKLGMALLDGATEVDPEVIR
jgi:hypothetical protein